MRCYSVIMGKGQPPVTNSLTDALGWLIDLLHLTLLTFKSLFLISDVVYSVGQYVQVRTLFCSYLYRILRWSMARIIACMDVNMFW